MIDQDMNLGPSTTGPAPSPHTAAARPSPVELTADWTWVPIRSLGPRQRARVATHLHGLDERDRYLRFGYSASDAQISRYVDSLDFAQDEVFGIFNRRLELIAMAHLARPLPATPGAADPAPMAEFGVSVSPKARGRGFGRRLFEHAMLHARNRGVAKIFIHALSENTAMLRIARSAGAVVERDGAESEAWLSLPPDTLASQVGELVETQAAELDYHFKQQARRVGTLFDMFAEVRAHTVRSGHAIEQ